MDNQKALNIELFTSVVVHATVIHALSVNPVDLNIEVHVSRGGRWWPQQKHANEMAMHCQSMDRDYGLY
jgi:hypothetical protein